MTVEWSEVLSQSILLDVQQNLLKNWFFAVKINYSRIFEHSIAISDYSTIDNFQYSQLNHHFLVNREQQKKFKYSPKVLFTIGLLAELNHSLTRLLIGVLIG